MAGVHEETQGVQLVAGFWVTCSRTGAFLSCLSGNDVEAMECSIS
jgi:hypothetical protein